MNSSSECSSSSSDLEPLLFAPPFPRPISSISLSSASSSSNVSNLEVCCFGKGGLPPLPKETPALDADGLRPASVEDLTRMTSSVLYETAGDVVGRVNWLRSQSTGECGTENFPKSTAGGMGRSPWEVCALFGRSICFFFNSDSIRFCSALLSSSACCLAASLASLVTSPVTLRSLVFNKACFRLGKSPPGVPSLLVEELTPDPNPDDRLMLSPRLRTEYGDAMSECRTD
mgnify:CR=1 FL=1